MVVESLSRRPFRCLAEWKALREDWERCKRQHEANVNRLGEMRGGDLDRTFPGMIDINIACEESGIKRCKDGMSTADESIAPLERRLRCLREM